MAEYDNGLVRQVRQATVGGNVSEPLVVSSGQGLPAPADEDEGE